MQKIFTLILLFGTTASAQSYNQYLKNGALNVINASTLSIDNNLLGTSINRPGAEFNSGRTLISNTELAAYLLTNSTPVLFSDTIPSRYIAAFDNKVYGIKQVTFKEDWMNTDNSVWASLTASSSSERSSFTLFSSGTVSGSNGTGAFVINSGNGNSFSFSTNNDEGIIGWQNISETKIFLAANTIETGATFKTTSSITVFEGGDLSKIAIPENIQGYFASSNAGTTGLLIENSNSESVSFSGITFKQGTYSNLIATCSGINNSNFYLPGSLVIEGNSPGGVLVNTVSSIAEFPVGSIRFAVNNHDILRIIDGSLLIGTDNEEPSSILTIVSNTRGVLFPSLTTAEIKNIKEPKESLMMFNKTRKKYWFYNGHEYEEIVSIPVSEL